MEADSTCGAPHCECRAADFVSLVKSNLYLGTSNTCRPRTAAMTRSQRIDAVTRRAIDATCAYVASAWRC